MNIFQNISIALTAAMLFASCGQNTKDESQAVNESAQEESSEIALTEQQMKAVDIELGQFEQKNLTQTIRTSGNIQADPQSRADITPLIAGMVKSICVQEGDNVRAGQTVAWIENTSILEMQKNYLTAIQETQASRQELQRQKNLSSQGAGVGKNLQQAQNAYNIALATSTGIAQQLQQLSISPSAVAKGKFTTRIPLKAPIGGTIGKIAVCLGSYVDVSTVLMDIVNDNRVHCDVMVYEKDINKIKKGQSVDLTLTNSPGTVIKGIVAGRNSSFVNEAKAIKVHVKITNRNGAHLLPGASVNALINLNAQKVDALPNDAIVNAGGKKYIFVQKGISAKDKSNLFEQVEVGVGVSELGYTHVMPIKPLPQGAIVVKKNAFYILSMIEGGEEED